MYVPVYVAARVYLVYVWLFRYVHVYQYSRTRYVHCVLEYNIAIPVLEYTRVLEYVPVHVYRYRYRYQFNTLEYRYTCSTYRYSSTYTCSTRVPVPVPVLQYGAIANCEAMSHEGGNHGCSSP